MKYNAEMKSKFHTESRFHPQYLEKSSIVSQVWGYKPKHNYMNGIVLAGATLPWLYDLPAMMIPKDKIQIPSYTIDESYHLSDDSFKFFDGHGNLCWLDWVRLGARPHELNAGEATPGFWELINIRNRVVPNYKPEQVRRMVINIHRFIQEKGDPKGRIAAIVQSVLRPT